MIDESEKKCDSNMECLLTTKNSENVKFILINDLSYMNDNRREEITVNLSMTLLEFKQLLGKKFTTPWH